MQGGQSRGERTGAGKDRFFVLLLLLDLFCLWSVKSCSGGCPPRLGCTHTGSPGCQGWPLHCSGESPGWPGLQVPGGFK